MVGTLMKYILMGFLTFLSLTSHSDDPMRPPSQAISLMKELVQPPDQENPSLNNKKEYSALILSSILTSSKRKVAIINNKVMSIGDKIDNARLTHISKNHVHLVEDGKRIDLYLKNRAKISIKPRK